MDTRGRSGVTLIELAIVLVVIGLLIGGILVAQGMIKTARVNKFVSTIGQYEIMTANFKSKYSCLPGELSSLPHDTSHPARLPVCNGLIEVSLGGNSNHYGGEIFNFWHQLSSTERLPDGRIYPLGTAFGEIGPYVPKIDYGQNCGIMAGKVSASSSMLNNNVWYISGHRSGADGTVGCMNGFDMFPVDIKIDDSLPHTGDMVADASGTTGSIQFSIGSNGAGRCYDRAAPNAYTILDDMHLLMCTSLTVASLSR